MKRILVVAGGLWQVPIIRKAKAMGYYVGCINPFKNSPGFEFADEFSLSDVRDKETVLEFAKEFMPDAIITDQSDVAVPTVAYVSEELGLCGIGIFCAELFTNKYKMREYCKINDFYHPDYKLCTQMQDAFDFANEAGYPIVIKPLASQSSKGVYIIGSSSELEERYADSCVYSDSETLIAEKYIQGVELTVEGFQAKGKHVTLAISKKKHGFKNPSIASELFYSYDDDEIDYARLRAYNNRLIEGTNLPFGITHVEYIFDGKNFYLVEMAARGGGTKISSDIVPTISGIDTNKLLIGAALGESVQEPQPTINQICCSLAFFNFKPGVIKNITYNNILMDENVLEYKVELNINDEIVEPHDDRSRHGFFIAKGSDKEALETLVAKIVREGIYIEYKVDSDI